MTSSMLTTGSVTPIDGLLTWLVQSTVLLSIGLLAGRLLRRRGPAVQSTLYRTLLVAVFLCPIASMAIAALGFPGLVIRLSAPGRDAAASDSMPGGGPVTTIAGPDADPIADGIDRAPESITPSAEVWNRSASTGAMETATKPSMPLATSSPTDPARSPARPDWIGRAGAIVLAAWLLGSGILALRLLAGHRRMARLRATACRAEPELEALCRDLARRMRLASPSVLRSPFLSSPCLDGLRRPAILLPEDTDPDPRDTFVHELAHLARRDGLWNLLRRSATAMLWVQPLLWVLSRRIEATAEEVCDDFVVAFGGDRARYAGHLLELAGRRLPPLAPSGVGMVSLRSLLARRIARILDSTRSLSTRAGRRAIALTLLAGLAGTLLVGLLGVGSGEQAVRADEVGYEPRQAVADFASTPSVPQPGSARQTINGRVVGPDGEPLAGVTVAIARYRRAGIGPYGEHGERQELDRTTSDEAGRFRLSFEGSEQAMSQGAESPDRWRDTFLVASTPGFGPAWVRVEPEEGESARDRTLRLVRDDVPITGRLVDLEGRPVAGASVRMVRLWQSAGLQESGQRQKPVAGSPGMADREESKSRPSLTGPLLPGNEPAVSGATATDADGRFRLTGLGRDRVATLAISGPTIVFRRVNICTKSMKPVAGTRPDAPRLDDPTFYGSDCTIVAAPGRPIEGVVRDADTRAPIPGAIVTAMQLAGSFEDIEGVVSAVADAEGRYRLVGLPKANGHRVSVYPPLDQPYFITQFLTVPEGPGLGPVRFDIALKRGIWITGRVHDAETGRPVQAALHYYPFLANEHARDYRNFDAGRRSLEWTGSRHRTDAQGHFRVVGLPGRGILAAKTFDRSYRLGIGADTIPERPTRRAGREEGLPTYNHIDPPQFQALAGIDPPTGVEEFRHDLKVEPAPSLTVRLVDPEGKPLTHAWAWGRFPSPIDMGDLDLYEQSRTQIVGLDPAVLRTVIFQHQGRKLGAILTIRPGEAVGTRERTVVLHPCATVTGRVVDADGKPVAGGVQIRLSRQEGRPDHASPLLPVAIESDGRFRIESLVPGGTYTLQARDRMAYGLSAGGKIEPERFKPFELARNLTAESGKVIDIGTFSAATGQKVKEADRPSPAQNDVPITGRIVDLEGRPIAGATVSVKSVFEAKGGDIGPWLDAVRRGEPPWVAYRHLEEDKEKPSGKAATDAQGRFRLDGLGAERVVTLAIAGPTIAYTTLEVVTRRIDPIPARGFTNTHGPGTETIYGPEFTFTAAPGRVVEGVVRDAGSKAPMGDVGVWSNHFAGSGLHGIKDVKTRTDAEGRFRLVGLPKGKGNALLIVPSDDHPYFMREFEVPDPTGIGAVPVEIGLHKGIRIEGKIIDKETGKPVEGAWLHYFPFLDNRFAQATPEFHSGGYTDGSGHQDRYASKPDGTYRLVGLPGRAIVGTIVWNDERHRQGAGAELIQGMDEHGNFPTWSNPIIPGRHFPTSMKEINPPEGTETFHVDFELDPGAKVRLRVVDHDGKTVSGVKAAGRIVRGRYDREAQPEAAFNVVTLSPGEDRMVLLVHEGRKLGRVIHVKEGDDRNNPVVVTLEPTATIIGRVLDADGNPVAGATVRSDPQPSGDFSISLPQVTSDKDGKFAVPGVPTGCEYALVVESGATIQRQRVAFAEHVAVRPGETTDVGAIRFKND